MRMAFYSDMALIPGSYKSIIWCESCLCGMDGETDRQTGACEHIISIRFR
jgi:hypothetical protein